MNKAKNVIFNSDGMVRQTRNADMNTCYEEDSYVFQDELKLIKACWQNSGCYFELEGSEGNKLYMSHSQFNELLEKKDIKVYGKFEFLKQGTIQSIGLIKEDTGE